MNCRLNTLKGKKRKIIVFRDMAQQLLNQPAVAMGTKRVFLFPTLLPTHRKKKW